MEIKDMIAVLRAAERGETIECYNIHTRLWDALTLPLWNFRDCYYRVAPKPEPKLVPHWPAITTTRAAIVYLGGLFQNEEAGRACYNDNFIRLATEYPPIMLPEVE